MRNRVAVGEQRQLALYRSQLAVVVKREFGKLCRLRPRKVDVDDLASGRQLDVSMPLMVQNIVRACMSEQHAVDDDVEVAEHTARAIAELVVEREML